jgi:hypothetical protein
VSPRATILVIGLIVVVLLWVIARQHVREVWDDLFDPVADKKALDRTEQHVSREIVVAQPGAIAFHRRVEREAQERRYAQRLGEFAVTAQELQELRVFNQEDWS